MSTLIVEHNGAKITYDEQRNRWTAVVKDRTYYADSLAEVKKKIDVAGKAKLKRIPVLMLRNLRFIKGEVTSVTGYSQVRITFEDGARDEVYESSLYERTPENVELVAQALEVQKKISALTMERDAILSKLTYASVRGAIKAHRMELQRGEAA